MMLTLVAGPWATAPVAAASAARLPNANNPQDPVRRCKASDISCSYFGGIAYCDFNVYVSGFLIDATIAGHSTICFYHDNRPYDVNLQFPASQVNVTTGTVRAVYIPQVPSTTDDSAGDEDCDDVDQEKLDETVANMPDTLSAPLMCPITQRVMLDPVVAADGFTYEKTAIVRWLLTKDKSPLTGKPLRDQPLRRNYNLRALVTPFIEKKKKKRDEGSSSSNGGKRMKMMKPI